MKSKLSLILLLSVYVSATDLTGYITVGTGYLSLKDNFLINSTNDNIASLNKKADSHNKYYVLPNVELKYGGYFVQGGEIGYSWKEDNKIYFVPKGYGVTQKFGDIFSYSLEQSKEEAYADVYAINSDKIVKNSKLTKLEIETEKVFDVLDINYQLVKIQLDDVVNADTKQSGINNVIELMYLLPNSTQLFKNKLGVVLGNGNYEGDSNDNISYGLKYDMKLLYNAEHIYMFKVDYRKYNFDTQNSYFNTIRDEKSFGASLIYTKLNFMNHKKVFFNVIGFVKNTDSNIEFFKNSAQSIAFTLGYKF